MSRISSNRVTTTFALVWLSLATLAVASMHLPAEDSADYRQWQEFREFQEFQAWQRVQRVRKRVEEAARSTHWKRHQWKGQDPPPTDQVALMARYIVNQANWTSVATIGSQKDTLSYPFANVISFSNGPLGNDNRATLVMTLAQGGWCHYKDYDPMDPRCARVILSGKIKAVYEDNPVFPIAQSAVFGRHPALAHVPKSHHFYFAKLKMSTITVLDTFGGPKYVSIEDYLNPPNSAEFGARRQIKDKSHE